MEKTMTIIWLFHFYCTTQISITTVVRFESWRIRKMRPGISIRFTFCPIEWTIIFIMIPSITTAAEERFPARHVPTPRHKSLVVSLNGFE